MINLNDLLFLLTLKALSCYYCVFAGIIKFVIVDKNLQSDSKATDAASHSVPAQSNLYEKNILYVEGGNYVLFKDSCCV